VSEERIDRCVALLRAEALINGPRAEAYGDALDNLGRIGRGWGEIVGVPISASQVALMMAWLKIARIAGAPPADNCEDSFVDALGYGALAAELRWRERSR